MRDPLGALALVIVGMILCIGLVTVQAQINRATAEHITITVADKWHETRITGSDDRATTTTIIYYVASETETFTVGSNLLQMDAVGVHGRLQEGKTYCVEVVGYNRPPLFRRDIFRIIAPGPCEVMI